MNILLIDNYDSFTYNLAHLFEELGANVSVFRNDAISAVEADSFSPSKLVISPGPGRPSESGNTIEILARLSPKIPTLGVCLGHQAIIEVYGGKIGAAKTLMHGKTSGVLHNSTGIFTNLLSPLEAGRYHSLAATEIPESLEVTVQTTDGEIMAVRHKTYPVVGIQFHPESVLTPQGSTICLNFLEGRL